MESSAIEVDRLALGLLETNCHVVRPAGATECWVVDPGMEPEPLLERLEAPRLMCERIVLTHGHADHIAGVGQVKARWPNAKITASQADAAMLSDPWLNMSAVMGLSVTVPAPDELIEPGQTLELGPTRWQVLDTSGHTAGGVSFYCRQAGIVIVGDALFFDSVGRCDIPGGDFERLIGNIRRNLLSLPPETRVLSGHGPETTIGREAKHNAFLRVS